MPYILESITIIEQTEDYGGIYSNHMDTSTLTENERNKYQQLVELRRKRDQLQETMEKNQKKSNSESIFDGIRDYLTTNRDDKFAEQARIAIEQVGNGYYQS